MSTSVMALIHHCAHRQSCLVTSSPSRLPPSTLFFFFNAPTTTEIYTLSLHDALPIYQGYLILLAPLMEDGAPRLDRWQPRSEEHTSELQSPMYLVCRLLLEKKKTYIKKWIPAYRQMQDLTLFSQIREAVKRLLHA